MYERKWFACSQKSWSSAALQETTTKQTVTGLWFFFFPNVLNQFLSLCSNFICVSNAFNNQRLAWKPLPQFWLLVVFSELELFLQSLSKFTGELWLLLGHPCGLVLGALASKTDSPQIFPHVQALLKSPTQGDILPVAQSTCSNGALLWFQRWDQAIQHASKAVELALKIDNEEVVK